MLRSMYATHPRVVFSLCKHYKSFRGYPTLHRQNYSEQCEAGVNAQVSQELHAAYTYQAMAAHFDRGDVALPGFSRFFQENANEEVSHARLLIEYQNRRGGNLIFSDILKPKTIKWESGLVAMHDALVLEKEVNQSLLNLHTLANEHNDPQLTEFLESHFLEEQVLSMKKLRDYIETLKRNGQGLGESIFDQYLFRLNNMNNL